MVHLEILCVCSLCAFCVTWHKSNLRETILMLAVIVISKSDRLFTSSRRASTSATSPSLSFLWTRSSRPSALFTCVKSCQKQFQPPVPAGRPWRLWGVFSERGGGGVGGWGPLTSVRLIFSTGAEMRPMSRLWAADHSMFTNMPTLWDNCPVLSLSSSRSCKEIGSLF